MATVHYLRESKKENVCPAKGDRFWWFKSDRVLMALTVLETTGGGIKLRWDHYCGLVDTIDPVITGEMIWDQREWDAATLVSYVEPVKTDDLDSGEKLCTICNGTYFETERDLGITLCWWCSRNKPGIKSLPA